MTPGLLNLPAAAYHADPCPTPSLSSGIARRLINLSPLHAWHAHPKLNPAYAPENSTMMDAGSVAHEMLLGGESRIVVVQADDWRTKAAKEQRDDAWANGGIPVLAHKMDEIAAMVASARAYVAASEIAGVFDDGDAELSGVWQEGETWCRMRPDWLTKDRAVIIDYKTGAGSAEPFGWSAQMMRMGYEMQAAWYVRGLQAIEPAAHPDFIFLVQENEPPYACSLIAAAPAMMDLANRKIEFALTLWRDCLAKNKWDGYPSRVAWAEPPAWAIQSFEERFELGGQA